jgi:hypothetical protein
VINLISVSQVVSELSVAQRDTDRQNYLRHLVLVKSVIRDLKYNYLNAFKRVYLQIDKTTNTVRLPFDYNKFVTISFIEDCFDKYGKPSQKVLPLTHNPYINITPFAGIDNACVKECGCKTSNPVCEELANYTTITEEVVVSDSPVITGTKTTVIRTCANGDIEQEICEPVLQFIEGALQCDYSVTMEIIVESVCSYGFSFPDVNLPAIITVTLNGDEVVSGSLASFGAVATYLESLGFTDEGLNFYSIEATTDVFDDMVVTTDDSPPEEVPVDMGRHCTEGNILVFPYTIYSYELNGEVVIADAEINNQGQLDAFFAALGFTKVDDTHYTKEDSENVYSNLEIYHISDESPIDSPPESPPDFLGTIDIVQSSCTRPLVNNGIQTECRTEFLCHVTVKACGCIEETASNIQTIVACCTPFLNSCQVGMLNNWSGDWGCNPCPTNTPQPYSVVGTYRLDEPNYLIYLDSVNADRLLLAYHSDGICDGEFLVPDLATEAIKAGMAYRGSQYEDGKADKEWYRRNYSRELFKFSQDMNPLKWNEVVAALRTRVKY